MTTRTPTTPVTVATSTTPAAVSCRVTDATRFDLRVDGVTYLGAAIHGAGGVLRGYDAERFASFWRRRSRDTSDVILYTTHTATAQEYVSAPPASVEVLRVWPST